MNDSITGTFLLIQELNFHMQYTRTLVIVLKNESQWITRVTLFTLGQNTLYPSAGSSDHVRAIHMTLDQYWNNSLFLV